MDTKYGLWLRSLSREEFSFRLFIAMCQVAEFADEYGGSGVRAEGLEFKPFQPDLGDKWGVAGADAAIQ